MKIKLLIPLLLPIVIGMVACTKDQHQSNPDRLTDPIDSTATAFNPANIKEQMIYQRALQAVIWGMPAVNYDLMLQQMLTKTNSKHNEIVFRSYTVADQYCFVGTFAGTCRR